MIDGNKLRKIFSENTAATEIIMKRCSGKEISVELTFEQNFVGNGVSCKSAVMDNTDSEYQFIMPAGVKRFQGGLMLILGC